MSDKKGIIFSVRLRSNNLFDVELRKQYGGWWLYVGCVEYPLKNWNEKTLKDEAKYHKQSRDIEHYRKLIAYAKKLAKQIDKMNSTH